MCVHFIDSTTRAIKHTVDLSTSAETQPVNGDKKGRDEGAFPKRRWVLRSPMDQMTDYDSNIHNINNLLDPWSIPVTKQISFIRHPVHIGFIISHSSPYCFGTKRTKCTKTMEGFQALAFRPWRRKRLDVKNQMTFLLDSCWTWSLFSFSLLNRAKYFSKIQATIAHSWI